MKKVSTKGIKKYKNLNPVDRFTGSTFDGIGVDMEVLETPEGKAFRFVGWLGELFGMSYCAIEAFNIFHSLSVHRFDEVFK